MLIASTEITDFNLKKITNKDKPIADSAAATVKIKNENNWPTASSFKHEYKIKFKLTAKSNNSIDINTISILRRTKKIPKRPTINKYPTGKNKFIKV